MITWPGSVKTWGLDGKSTDVLLKRARASNNDAFYKDLD